MITLEVIYQKTKGNYHNNKKSFERSVDHNDRLTNNISQKALYCLSNDFVTLSRVTRV